MEMRILLFVLGRARSPADAHACFRGSCSRCRRSCRGSGFGIAVTCCGGCRGFCAAVIRSGRSRRLCIAIARRGRGSRFSVTIVRCRGGRRFGITISGRGRRGAAVVSCRGGDTLSAVIHRPERCRCRFRVGQGRGCVLLPGRVGGEHIKRGLAVVRHRGLCRGTGPHRDIRAGCAGRHRAARRHMGISRHFYFRQRKQRLRHGSIKQ